MYFLLCITDVTSRGSRANSSPIEGTFNCKSEGFHPDPFDCTSFYRCVNFGAGTYYTKFKFQCSPGTVFDPENSVCVHPSFSNREECKNVQFSNPEPEPSPEESNSWNLPPNSAPNQPNSDKPINSGYGSIAPEYLNQPSSNYDYGRPQAGYKPTQTEYVQPQSPSSYQPSPYIPSQPNSPSNYKPQQSGYIESQPQPSYNQPQPQSGYINF